MNKKDIIKEAVRQAAKENSIFDATPLLKKMEPEKRRQMTELLEKGGKPDPGRLFAIDPEFAEVFIEALHNDDVRGVYYDASELEGDGDFEPEEMEDTRLVVAAASIQGAEVITKSLAAEIDERGGKYAELASAFNARGERIKELETALKRSKKNNQKLLDANCRLADKKGELEFENDQLDTITDFQGAEIIDLKNEVAATTAKLKAAELAINAALDKLAPVAEATGKKQPNKTAYVELVAELVDILTSPNGGGAAKAAKDSPDSEKAKGGGYAHGLQQEAHAG